MPRPRSSTTDSIRLAVIGAGVMGRRHMQAAKTDAAVKLSAVYDIHSDRAAVAAQEFGTHSAASLEVACGLANAAVIATPTRTHKAVAMTCLSAGLHCLIEKPLAPSETECRELIDTASVKNLLLQVGHTERFNPAVETLWDQNLAPGDIRSISARRMNPATPRVIEDDVVVDLMVHDLDVILALKCAPVLEVAARDLAAEHSEAILTFADGAKATLAASRTAPERIREIEVVTDGTVVHVNYADRTAWANHRRSGESGSLERCSLTVGGGDALQQQLAHFAACIRGAKSRVSGDHALVAMKLAWRIQAAIRGAI